ncbi:MAG TPA: hypothetical protein VED40_02285 [Azospirillaceae bacterium]|nr:hypothetical protein [Azospirillaceae bacterium]
MAYAVTRMPRLSPYWGVQDRLKNRWCAVPASETAAHRLCNALNEGRVDPARLPWLPLGSRAFGEPGWEGDLAAE